MTSTLAPAHLGAIIADCVAPYRVSHPEVVFDLSHVREDVDLRLDARRFAQALTNLIINAIDAMDEKGRLEIRSDLVQKRERRYCRISLHDSGGGIAPESMARIFTPYFTTKQRGTGLGLSIVERIVSDHGGEVWCESAPQVGTTFFIDLPLESPASPEEASPLEA